MHATEQERFRHAKYADWFECLDRNGNGRLDLGDLSLYVRSVVEALGWDTDDERFIGLLERVSVWWTEMAAKMDLDDNGSLSRDELLNFFDTASDVAARRGVPHWAWHVVDAVFSALDIDGDGFLSPEEYRLYLEAIGSDADAAAAFARLDVDGDGQIDLSELDTLFEEWVRAEEPGARGNLLLTGREPTDY
jgi:Ca2+-binding EF-hand superfamily protein